jgi:hypothetical protein
MSQVFGGDVTDSLPRRERFQVAQPLFIVGFIDPQRENDKHFWLPFPDMAG